jgi:enoyl-[acyl-carrier protein] reductase I
MAGRNGAMLTLTYFGAEKVIPHYNIMGVTKAALEASMRYLANDLVRRGSRQRAFGGTDQDAFSQGCQRFQRHVDALAREAPMQRNITSEDVGRAGLYLLSDLSSGVTGEVHHVDCGYNVIGM